MRTLCIDYGDSRIGIAVSDPFGWTAQGVETIKWNGNLSKPLERILNLIKEYNISKIVVGFPRNMNGTLGPRAEKTQEFIELLKAQIEEGGNNSGNASGVEIIRWDERLSTVSAHRTMHEIGIKTSKKKGVVDQIAAVFILQGYLDSVSKKT